MPPGAGAPVRGQVATAAGTAVVEVVVGTTTLAATVLLPDVMTTATTMPITTKATPPAPYHQPREIFDPCCCWRSCWRVRLDGPAAGSAAPGPDGARSSGIEGAGYPEWAPPERYRPGAGRGRVGPSRRGRGPGRRRRGGGRSRPLTGGGRGSMIEQTFGSRVTSSGRWQFADSRQRSDPGLPEPSPNRVSYPFLRVGTVK